MAPAWWRPCWIIRRFRPDPVAGRGKAHPGGERSPGRDPGVCRPIIRWPPEPPIAPQDLPEYFLVLPQQGKTRTPPERLAGAGRGRHPHLDGARLHRNDEALCHGGPGRHLPGGIELPGGGRRRKAEGRRSRPSLWCAVWADLSQGQGAFQGRAGVYPGRARTCRGPGERRRNTGWSHNDVQPLPEDVREGAPDVRIAGRRDVATSGTFQVSSVLISTGSSDRVYRSVDEVPSRLRPGS